MIKGVIFDMDGVLVDNSDIHVEAFVKFCDIHNVEITEQKLKSLFGMGNEDIMPCVFGREMDSEEIDRLAQEKEAIYRDIFADKIEPMAGLKSILEQLKQRDIKIAVGSSGMAKNVDFVLAKCGIASYFSAIANGDMVKKAKPSPEIFLKAASLLNLEPSECVVFEDSFAGVEAARRAGMKVIVLATTFARSEHKDYDILIDDFTQITAEQVVNI